MSSKHTVPAMREMARNLREKAARDLAAAKAEAEDLCRAADEIDADANAKEAAQKQAAVGPQEPVTVPCWNCGQPVYQDPLGWRHTHPNETACQVPGLSEHDHYRVGPEDTLVVSQQSTVQTGVDGQHDTPEVTQ